MIRIRPYRDPDEKAVLSWCRDEKTYYNWTAGVLGSYPLTGGDFRKTASLVRFTALEGKDPVGFFTVRDPGDIPGDLRFGFVIVDPDRRRRGIGKTMLRLGLAYAFRVLGAERVSLGVFEDNLPALACYESAGFRRTMRREVYPVSGKDRTAVEMECRDPRPGRTLRPEERSCEKPVSGKTRMPLSVPEDLTVYPVPREDGSLEPVIVQRVEKDTPLAKELLAFVEDCSWLEVKAHMAALIRDWAFHDWEAPFAAVADGRIVGMATVMKTDYYPLPGICPWISSLFVSEDHRGRRISGRLIDSANEYARKTGFTKTFIPSEFEGLYEKYGYRYVKDIVNYGNGVDRLYVKELE